MDAFWSTITMWSAFDVPDALSSTGLATTAYAVADATAVDVPTLMVIFGTAMIVAAPEFRRPWLYMMVATVFYTGIIVILIGMYLCPRMSETKQVLVSGLAWAAFGFGMPPTWKLGAFLIAVLIGGAYAFWQGAPSSPRTLVLVEGLVTLIGVAFVVLAPADCAITSITCRLAHIGWAVVVLVVNKTTGFEYVANWLTRRTNRIRWFFFPPSQERLSMDEYNRRGEEDTRTGLANLRKAHVSAGDIAAYNAQLARLENPKNFIQFASGSDHVPAAQANDHEKRVDFSSLLQKNYAEMTDDEMGYYEEPVVRTPKRATPSQRKATSHSRSTNGTPSHSRSSAAAAPAPASQSRSWFQPAAPAAAQYESVPSRSPSPEPSAPEPVARRPAAAAAVRTGGSVWRKADLEKLSNPELLKVLEDVGMKRRPVTASTRGFVISKITGQPKN